jgi:hypothetical protein
MYGLPGELKDKKEIAARVEFLLTKFHWIHGDLDAKVSANTP